MSTAPVPPMVPRIYREIPTGRIKPLDGGEPVIVRIRWMDGQDTDMPAIATAWTNDAVEITWNAPASMGRRTDWVAAVDVRRTVEPPAVDRQLPPSTRGQLKRPRW